MPLPLSLKVNPGWSGATPQESISALRHALETGGIIIPFMRSLFLPRIPALCAVAAALSGGSIGSACLSET